MIDLNNYQHRFAAWQQHNFPNSSTEQMALGVCEEAGELAHWVLKYKQGIRGVNNQKAKTEVADAFGDIVVYSLQLLTMMGLDAEKSLIDCFSQVLNRDWKANPTGDGYTQHKEG